jgi:cell division transport system ATP-binding protein
MIRLHHVGKVFGAGPARRVALSDVSFSVARGDFAVLSGPSGAGKTTLLRLIYREELPTEGEIEIAGIDVPGLRRRQVPRLRRSIGIVFQDAKLLAGRTVFENIAFVLRVIGTPRRDITPRAFAALKAVGLSSRAQAYPKQLSQGEAQRASLARAIAKSPGLLLADEPTGNLDDDMAEEILEVIRDIWQRGTTVFLATHQAGLAAHLKRRTLTLDGGRLVKDEG